MPKIKPLLLFIIISIALHWLALSSLIFHRIEPTSTAKSNTLSATIISTYSQSTPIPEKRDYDPIKPTESNNQTNGNNEKIPPILPTHLRGSPWLRRPAEARSRNFSSQLPMSALTQIEITLQNEAIDFNTSNLQCKRSGGERLFVCQESNQLGLPEKIAKILNQMSNSSTQPIPECVTLESRGDKWHAKACH